ncbi:TraB/GumN family protein [Fulvivirga sp. M361]|uniref:TraB/GumN family protein n=1 Tax=Fulvivirga sp. M361 TaxID=2594266 RepID=UPI00117BC360|nr:TraB/GumN family protein [Fulvivirga sp. M361]TRX51749.1 TraB/GumN family protein [Fulvivirga sp. M361]
MNKAVRFTSMLSLILIFVISSNVSAQNYKKNAILWEVSGNGLETPSYIMAILKFVPESKYSIPQEGLEKLKACKILSTETLLDHHAKHELNKAAHLEHHESLKDYLTKEEFKQLEKLFHDKLGVGKLKFEMVYSKFKPVMLSTTITRLAQKEKVRYYELELLQLAETNGLISLGLETVEREVAALEKFALEDQIHSLKHTINNFEEQVEDYEKVVEYYKQGDLHNTLEYTLHPVEGNRNFKKYFIEERNKEWLPKMIGYMNRAPTFFAIGASHLADDISVLKLLADQGYDVKPLPSK